MMHTMVGIPQGSSWSPELSTLYIDVEGVADRLHEVSEGIIELNGAPVHLLMYADDLANPNFREEGAQQQFSQTEAAAERDGLRISYKKTELIVFRRGPRKQTAKKVVSAQESGRDPRVQSRLGEIPCLLPASRRL